jgi:hypothetical protein
MMAGKDVPVSPLAPKRQPKVPAVPGVRFATAEAGIRYKGRTDVVLVLLDEGSQAAGVFTKLEMSLGPGRLVPGEPGRSGKARASSSIPATPTPSPARRAAPRPGADREDRRQGGGLQGARRSSSPRPA